MYIADGAFRRAEVDSHVAQGEFVAMLLPFILRIEVYNNLMSTLARYGFNLVAHFTISE
jgi:hypothetical protein